MQRLRRHLTFANTVSALALFVALSGSAYALSLGRDSVKSRHIVNDTVRGADVRDDSLGQRDINENSLTVPAARVTFDETQNKSIPDTVSNDGTTVSWNQEVFDTQGLHSASDPTVLKAPVPGIYTVSATVELNNAADNDGLDDAAYWLWIQSGTSVLAQTQTTTFWSKTGTSWDPLDLNVSALVSLDKGDTVSAGVYQYSGQNQPLPLSPGDGQSSFQMARLGAQDGAPGVESVPFSGRPTGQ